MKIISIINKKGGVAKTTTTIHLSAYLAKKGYKVLVIDFDPQCNLTSGYKVESNYPYNIYDLLEGKEGLRFKNKLKNLYILAGSENLDTKVYPVDLLKNRLYILYKMVKTQLNIDFDYIIIDCSPSDLRKKKDSKGALIPKLNQLALTASDYFIVPLVADDFSVEGLNNFIFDAIEFKKEFNPNLKVGGVFFNRALVHKVKFKNFYKQVQNSIPEKYFIKTFIREDVSIANAVEAGQSIFQTAPKSRAAQDYKKLCNELLKTINNE